MRVLGVDDSSLQRALLQDCLVPAGFELDLACCAAEALQMVNRSSYDIVLTDYHMDEVDGIELVRRLREIPDYRFRPILVVTTETSETIKRQARMAGATGWVTKPYQPEILLAAVRRALPQV